MCEGCLAVGMPRRAAGIVGVVGTPGQPAGIEGPVVGRGQPWPEQALSRARRRMPALQGMLAAGSKPGPAGRKPWVAGLSARPILRFDPS